MNRPNLQPDQGLAGFGMPGPFNRMQGMGFDAPLNQYSAIGIPNTPYDDANPNRPPVVNNLTASTLQNTAVSVTLKASDPDPRTSLTLRIVSQTVHGRVAFKRSVATYRPDPGYTGSDVFTYAAWDGSADSNLATVTVQVRP